jgi:hypothetical protein
MREREAGDLAGTTSPADLEARGILSHQLLVKRNFVRIRFWYSVTPGSGISRGTGRIFFWISHSSKEEPWLVLFTQVKTYS